MLVFLTDLSVSIDRPEPLVDDFFFLILGLIGLVSPDFHRDSRSFPSKPRILLDSFWTLSLPDSLSLSIP